MLAELFATILAVAGPAVEVAPGGLAGFVAALVAGGVGGGGLVALVLSWLFLRHLREEHDTLIKMIETVSARNAALTDKLVGMVAHPAEKTGG